MPASLDFEFRFSKPRRQGGRPDEASAFRILVIADLSGRANRGLCQPGDLASRPIAEVDVDNLERVMARLAPRLELATAPGADRSVALAFGTPDDFHPDPLYRSLDLFRGLRDTRARLSNPATFAQAAAELRQEAARMTSASAQPPAAAPGAVEDDANTLERLLGRPPAGTGAEGAKGAGIEALIRSIVAPYIVPEADPFQAEYLASVDAAIGDQMRAILHHPQFQALEAAWRGVQWLVANLELGEELKLFLLDASRDELAADIAAAGGTLDASALYRRLVEREAEAPGGEPWSLLVGDFSFGTAASDAALLGALGAIASQAGAPLLAGADAGVLGCRSVAQTPDPRDWPGPDAESAKRWQALRRSPFAEWVGLALPRVLLRVPYGKKTDAVESFAFEELAPDRDHESYLWGNPAFACALLLGQSFTQGGWEMGPGDALEIGDLPAHTWTEDGESRLQPCAEALLGERGGEAIVAKGLIPLLSFKNRNAVRVLRIQSIAEPARPLAGRWVGR